MKNTRFNFLVKYSLIPKQNIPGYRKLNQNSIDSNNVLCIK